MKKALALIPLIVLSLLLSPVHASAANDDTQSVNRLRIVVTTSSDWTRLTVPVGDKFVMSRGSLTSGSAFANATDNTIYMGQKPLGTLASSTYDVLISTDGVSDGQWEITKGWGQNTHVDIYNMNDSTNPQLIASVDDANENMNPYLFVITGSDESRNGPLSAGIVSNRQVLAIYYPWYGTGFNWDLATNDRLIDNPDPLYYTDVPGDVGTVIDNAQANGVTGFLVSYQGKKPDGHGGWTPHESEPRTDMMFERISQRSDFSGAIYMETRCANSNWDWTGNPDPAIIRQWVKDIVTDYGSQRGYLRINGKPVIFFYWAKLFTPQQWKDEVIDPLRAEGIDAYYVADYTGTTGTYYDYLAVFDGMSIFNPSTYDNMEWVLESRAVITKTYSMLADQTAQRKLWVGTVQPGKDARAYGNYPEIGEPYVDRRNGDQYRYMWDANISTNPDWVMVSTWNDYWMNTHIESSLMYGNTYLNITKAYSNQFISEPASQDLSISDLSTFSFLPAGFKVNWQTDRRANTILEYGTASNLYTKSVTTNSSTIDHQVIVADAQPGIYHARVRSMDPYGDEAVSQEFVVVVSPEVPPELSIALGRSYWSDMASFRSRELSSDFIISNAGSASANNTQLVEFRATSGASRVEIPPVDVGDIGAGSSRTVTLRWQVREGVSSFKVSLWAQAVTAGGETYYYPEVPPSG